MLDLLNLFSARLEKYLLQCPVVQSFKIEILRETLFFPHLYHYNQSKFWTGEQMSSIEMYY